MHLGADMMGDEPHDALAIGRRHSATAILEAARQSVDPKPSVRIEHHLDDGGVFEKARDGQSERCAQHARAARMSLRMEKRSRQIRPRFSRSREGERLRG
jgi:hypothetical protein